MSFFKYQFVMILNVDESVVKWASYKLIVELCFNIFSLKFVKP